MKFDTCLNTFVENCNKKIREWWIGYKPIEVRVGETYKGFVKICWNVPEKFLFIYVNKETGTIHEAVRVKGGMGRPCRNNIGTIYNTEGVWIPELFFG